MIDRDIVLLKLKAFKKEKASSFNIDKLGVFGSVARNEHDEFSDIDVVMSYTEPLDFFQLGKMKKELELLLNNKVDLITLHQYLQPSFLTNLNKDVVYV